MRVEGAVALVTGANRGLGQVLARALLERGASRVYGGIRDPRGVVEPGVIPVSVDVTDPKRVAAAADRCGDVTLLVNNAGMLTNSPLLAAPSMARAREEMEVNYFGTLAMCRAFAPVLARNGGGAIVTVLSIASWYTNPAMGSYSASKAAAWAMTNGVRAEVREHGTLVVAVHSGYIDTDMARHVTTAKNAPEDIAAQALDAVEAGRTEVLADDRTRRAKRAVGDLPGTTGSAAPAASGPAAPGPALLGLAAPGPAVPGPVAVGPGPADRGPVSTRRAAGSELSDALRVWRAANEARGRTPDAARIERVRRKLADPAALPVVAVDRGAVVGMALAEPGRADDGAGRELPDLCHVSMVFVDPAHWGRRIGELLLAEVAARAGKRRLQLWTGARNERAHRLYQRAGFVPTGRVREHRGETIVHLDRTL